MTFTEAALEVLRSVGEPLHYKKITEIAIERNLLSHVGKTPEVTMSSRLATMVKKDRGQAPIVKVKPGVFAIREGVDLDSYLEPREAESDESASNSDPDTADGEAAAQEPHALPGSDVFPAEDDDDDPILAGLEDGEEKRGRRRRRRRRGKGDKNDRGDDAAPATERHRDRERTRERSRERSSSRREARNEGPPLDLNRFPGDGDLLGKDLADAAFAVLGAGSRAPTDYVRVAELLVRRGRLSGPPQALAPTVAAAIRADIALAKQQHRRPRFRLVDGLLSLAEWSMPKEAQRAETDARRAAERQREQVRRAFVTRLSNLPAAGFAELLATWLNAEGITALRAVRRPGSSGGAFHFAGTQRRGAQELRLAIVVQRGTREVDRELVTATRGSLQHYGNASAAWLITCGKVVSGAREEAATEAAPVALFDGAELASAMEARGIGLQTHYVALSDIDLDLLEALGDETDQSARRDHGRDRSQKRDDGDSEGDLDREQDVDTSPEAASPEAEGDEADGVRRSRRGRGRGRTRGARGEADQAKPDSEVASASDDETDEGDRTATEDVEDVEAAEGEARAESSQSEGDDDDGEASDSDDEGEEGADTHDEPVVAVAGAVRIGEPDASEDEDSGEELSASHAEGAETPSDESAAQSEEPLGDDRPTPVPGES